MESNKRFIERVILPLFGHGDESRLLLAATVLASWLDVPIQLIAPDEESATACRALTDTVGVRSDPVVCIDTPSFIEGTTAHLRTVGPSVCVSTVDRGGLELAKRSGQTTFLVASSAHHRMASGPLALELIGRAEDPTVLATAAIWAAALGCGVRLVVSDQSIPVEELVEAEQRLVEVGVQVGVDNLRANHLPPLIVAGRTRQSTAIVISSERATSSDLISVAADNMVSVLVAPPMERRVLPTVAGEPAGAATSLGTLGGEVPGSLQAMSYEECLTALGDQSVARVAYVDEGWPTVIPVNYAVRDETIFIRSQEGGKLDAARRRDVVCIELDRIDEATRSGWSVVGHGRLELIHDPGTLATAWDNDPSPWIEGVDWHWLQLVPFSLTGRRLLPKTDSSRAREGEARRR